MTAPPDKTLTPSPDPPADVYLLGQLLDRDALDRLRQELGRVTAVEIAICDPTGRRLDLLDAPDTMWPLDAGPTYPVRWKSHTLGLVALGAAKPDRATRELAKLMADVLANLCKAEARVRKRVGELSAVYDLGGLFARSEDLETLLNVAARRICEVMNAKASSIRLLDETGRNLVIVGAHNLSDGYLRKGPVTLEDNAIDLAAFNGEIVYIEDAQTDPRVRYSDYARQEGIVSGLCCAMAYRGHNVGVLRIYSGRRRTYSAFDRELLEAVASQAAAAILHTRLFRERLAAAEYERQIRYAGQVQRRMLPDRPMAHARITFGQVYEPSLNVGGDFFDYLELPNGNLGLAIADVVGKGLPGALMMASVRSALRAHAHNIFNIDTIVGQVNRHLCRDTLISEFATLCYGVFAPDGSRFTYCNAGHNPPLLLRNDRFIEMDIGGMVIGVTPDEAYEREVLELKSGDLLVFYTDGATEALDFMEELYGLQRFKQSILRYRALPAPTLAKQLLWDVRRFAGLTRQSDDITIVAAKVE